MPSTFIYTSNSLYEHDPANRRIRRLEGEGPPTKRTTDGWRDYAVIVVHVGDSMIVAWGTNPDGSLATTVTSPVLAMRSSTERAVA
jgi:hypothetical protein